MMQIGITGIPISVYWIYLDIPISVVAFNKYLLNEYRES